MLFVWLVTLVLMVTVLLFVRSVKPQPVVSVLLIVLVTAVYVKIRFQVGLLHVLVSQTLLVMMFVRPILRAMSIKKVYVSL